MASIYYRGVRIRAAQTTCGQCGTTFDDGLRYELADVPEGPIRIDCPACNAFVAEWTPPLVLCVHCRMPKSLHSLTRADGAPLDAEHALKPSGHAFEPINPLDGDDGFDVDPDPEPGAMDFTPALGLEDHAPELAAAAQHGFDDRVIFGEAFARLGQDAAPLVLVLEGLDPAWRSLVQVLQSVAMAKSSGLELGVAVKRFDALLARCLILGVELKGRMTKAQLARAARSARSPEVSPPKAEL